MSKPKNLELVPGDENWKRLRDRYTKSIAGRYSSLYWMNAELLDLEDKVPMTFKAHWALCLFVEGKTGIKEIDSCRVKAAFVPRGVGKSTLITKGRAIHKLLQSEDTAIGIANEIQENANSFLQTIKLEFERNDSLRALFAERIPDDLAEVVWKADQITVKRKSQRRDPSVRAVGVGGTATGAHPDMWILDDLISKNAAEAARRGNFTEIEKTNQWVVELQPMMSNPMRDPIVVCATYWWEGDTYQWMEGNEETRGFWGFGEPATKIRWNLTLPNGERQSLMLRKRGDMAIFCRSIYDDTGHSWFPERYTDEELAKMEMQDPEFFASQMRLDPVASVTREFRKEWLRAYALDGFAVRFTDIDGIVKHILMRDLTTIISVDAAFSDKNTAARTAITVTGVSGDNIFLLEDFAERGQDVYDIAAKVTEFALKYKPVKVFIETTAQQAAVSVVIQNESKKAGLRYIPIEEISHHSEPNKIIRVYGLGPFFRSGRFFYHPSQTRFLEEYLSFPRNRVRDVLDALSFQRDEWEKLAAMPHANKDGTPSSPDASLDRFRESMGRLSGKARKSLNFGAGRWL